MTWQRSMTKTLLFLVNLLLTLGGSLTLSLKKRLRLKGTSQQSSSGCFVCPQGQGVVVEEEQLLATGSPPREWGKNMCLVYILNLNWHEEVVMVITSTYLKNKCVEKLKFLNLLIQWQSVTTTDQTVCSSISLMLAHLPNLSLSFLLSLLSPLYFFQHLQSCWLHG